MKFKSFVCTYFIASCFPTIQYQVGESKGIETTPAGTSLNPLYSSQAIKILEFARKLGGGYSVVTLPTLMGNFKVKVLVLE